MRYSQFLHLGFKYKFYRYLKFKRLLTVKSWKYFNLIGKPFNMQFLFKKKAKEKHCEPFRGAKIKEVVGRALKKGKIKCLHTQPLIKNNKRHVKHAAAKNAGSLFDKKRKQIKHKFMVQGGLKCRSQRHGKMPNSGRPSNAPKRSSFNGRYFAGQKKKQWLRIQHIHINVGT